MASSFAKGEAACLPVLGSLAGRHAARVMAVLLLICQLALAAILLLAATGKILNSEQFLAALRLSWIPKTLIMPLGISVPILEMGLALGLVLSPPQMLPLMLFATTGLLSLFTAWMAFVYLRGRRIKCGCFGLATTDIGPTTIVRNIPMLIVALGGLALTWWTRSPLPEPSLWMVLAAGSVGLCLMLLQALRQGRAAMMLSFAQLMDIKEDTKETFKA